MVTYAIRDTAGRVKLGPFPSFRDTVGRVKVAIPVVKIRDTAGRVMLRLSPLAIQRTSLSGVLVSLAAANLGGNSFLNDGRVWIVVSNSDSSTHTLTFKSQHACDQGVLHDDVVPVPAGTVRLNIGPFSVIRFNSQVDQTVQISYDAVTGVTIGAVSPP